MLSIYYRKYKLWVWLLLFLLFASGAVSKSYYADAWQIWLNAGCALLCLIVFLTLALRGKFKKGRTVDYPRPAGPASRQRQGRLILLFTGAGAVAAAALLPYTMAASQGVLSEIPLSLAGIAAITVAQVTVMTFAASAFGLFLASKVGLDAPLLRYWLYGGQRISLSFRWLGIGVLGSLAGTAAIAALEKLVFQPRLPELAAGPAVALWKGALTFLYGGVVEEVLLRLFVMSLLVWLLARLVRKLPFVPSWAYVCAIVLAAVLFGLGHLPASAGLFGHLTPLLVIRAIVSNGLLGIWFGYLYWKKGLEYAIAAHMCADLFLHVGLAAWLS